MDDKDLGEDPIIEVWGSDVWTYNTDGGLDRCRELRVSVFIVLELTILAKEQLFQGFLL